MTISASAIEALLAAGATCETLTMITRQHFLKPAATVDALIAANTVPDVIASLHGVMLASCPALAAPPVGSGVGFGGMASVLEPAHGSGKVLHRPRA
jgi:hypothetical protein